MSPVEVSSEIPAGREGETDHETGVPEPYRVGLAVDIAAPLDKIIEFGV